MNYSDKDNSVRVDFFKDSGKWHTTEAVLWENDLYDSDIIVSFAKVLKKHLTRESGVTRLTDMTAVCLQPYHRHSYPLMIKVSEIDNLISRNSI